MVTLPGALAPARRAVLTTVLALAVATSQALAQSPADGHAREGVDAVLEARKRGSDTLMRQALLGLAAHDDPLAVDVLLRVLEHEHAAYRPTARTVLGSYSRPATLERLARDGLGHRSEIVRAQVVLALGDARPPAFDWVAAAEAALDDESAEVRSAAVHVLGRARAEGRLDRIVELATDRSERVRKMVPEALARLVGERSLGVLRELGADPRWRVRVGVVRALSIVKTPSAVELLVDMLASNEGRVLEDILTALRRLTGRHLGWEAEPWRRFLEQAPADFLALADAANLTPPPPPTSSVRYYGVTTASQRLLFVTDLSGSMNFATSQRYAGTRSTSRLARTQTELLHLLEGLDESRSFNLLTFASHVSSWKRTLARASAATVRHAVDEVKGYRADGATNVSAALTVALDMAEQSLDDPRAVDDPDTVFFLSDGAPSEGEIRDFDLLVDLLAERNRNLELRLHCVSLTSDPAERAFLDRLAQQTGGRCVHPLD